MNTILVLKYTTISLTMDIKSTPDYLSTSFLNLHACGLVRWKTRSAECGVRGVENAECGKCGVWKMRGVENAECRKCGVWKMRSVENAGCAKCGVWKMWSMENE